MLASGILFDCESQTHIAKARGEQEDKCRIRL